MYQEFYKLTESPFRLSPDARYFLALGGHRKALAYLRYGLQKREGLIVVTGMPGTGKTTIARLLIAEAARDGVVVSQLNTTSLDADNVIQMVAASFGLPHEGRTKASLLAQLETFFQARARAGKHLLLLIDEAQNLPVQSLEELRMLSNFQTGNHALLQIFLLGQQQFREMLQLPDMEQLRQRVVAACHLDPLNRDETREYIEHRLRLAGWNGDPAISGDAVDAIFQTTRGIPRNINTFCERVLLFGALEGLHVLNRAAIMAVVRELRQEAAENVGAAPLEAELTTTDESMNGGIGQIKAAEPSQQTTESPLNPFSLDLSLSSDLPPSASTRTQTVAMHAIPGLQVDQQSLMATMTGPSGALGLSTSSTEEFPIVQPSAQPVVASSSDSATVQPKVTNPAVSSLARNESVKAVSETPPPASAAAPEAKTVVEKSAATTEKPAASSPSVERDRRDDFAVAMEKPAAVRQPVAQKPESKVTPAAHAPVAEQASTISTPQSTPNKAEAVDKPMVPEAVVATSVKPDTAVVSRPAAARSAAPATPPAVKTALASTAEDDDEIPVLTMEDHALSRSTAPESRSAKKAAEPVVKAPDMSAKDARPQAKKTDDTPVVVREPPPEKSATEPVKPTSEGNTGKPATGVEPASKPAPVRPSVGGVTKPSTPGSRSGSLAPMTRPAAQTTRLPSPLQRLLLVAEQVQANPIPTEALELVADALLEPLPELLQFALSKEPVNEEWAAALTQRPAPEVRELARQFLKTVIMAKRSDLYQVLCLTRDATDEQVQTNYRALFKLLQSGPGKEVHPAAASRLNHAYQVLRDPARRLAYEISPNSISEVNEAPISALPAAEPVSAVEKVPVADRKQASAVDESVEHGLDEDEELEEELEPEGHWWRPRPAVLIGVGVVIAAVFAVIISQMRGGSSAPTEQQAEALPGATPKAFSGEGNTAPVVESKPVTVKEPATVGGGGVAAPVTLADIQTLVKKLTSSYERGNIENFVALFDSNVKSNDVQGIASLRKDYQDVFSTTSRRGLDISNLRSSLSGPSAKAQGDIRVTVVDKENNQSVFVGKISLQVAKMGEQVYITGMDYKVTAQ